MRTALPLEIAHVGGPQGVMALSYRLLGTVQGPRSYSRTPSGKQAPGREAQAWVLVNRVARHPCLCHSVTVRPGLPVLWSLFPHWANGTARLSGLQGAHYLECKIPRISSTWLLTSKKRESTKDPTSFCSFVPQGLHSTTGKKPNPSSLLLAHSCLHLICPMLTIPALIQEHSKLTRSCPPEAASPLHLHRPSMSPLRSGPGPL